METFAVRLRNARILRGLSQHALARLCGVSQSAISSYENGTRLAPKRLLHLAQALDVDIYWLSQGQGSPARQPTTAQSDALWPFPSIDPQQFWSLTQKDRQVVENAVSALIDSLLIQK